jgi:hypothetical protein
MLKLGQISFSSCVPVHRRFPAPGSPESATEVSVAALKIIIRERFGSQPESQPEYSWLEQERQDRSSPLRYAGRYGWSGQLPQHSRSSSYAWTDELAEGLEAFWAGSSAPGKIAQTPEADFLELSDG